MAKTSAGVLPYRRRGGALEVLLVHPGGPLWARKDLGAWSIAKGEYEPREDPFAAALREFIEETGFRPEGEFIALQPRKQPSGKVIQAWAVETDWDPSTLCCNTFEMEWPRGSGRRCAFPEVDRAEWFTVEDAARRIVPGQRGFLEELQGRLEATKR
ncbi:MAG: NUDIX domain-containing protein [Candidatus Methylomirabilales bacterium]